MKQPVTTLDPAADDEVLVELAKQALPGDLRAFELLLERHKAHVLANCRSLSGSNEVAEDLAQEVFVKTYFALGSFEGRASFKTWIRRVKTNHCLNHIRKHKGKLFVEVNDAATAGSVELQVEPKMQEEAEQWSEQDRIRNVLASLPDTLRLPLTMCDMDGFAYQEIADMLGLGLSATKMRIKRGREEFRRRYEQGVSP